MFAYSRRRHRSPRRAMIAAKSDSSSRRGLVDPSFLPPRPYFFFSSPSPRPNHHHPIRPFHPSTAGKVMAEAMLLVRDKADLRRSLAAAATLLCPGKVCACCVAVAAFSLGALSRFLFLFLLFFSPSLRLDSLSSTSMRFDALRVTPGCLSSYFSLYRAHLPVPSLPLPLLSLFFCSFVDLPLPTPWLSLSFSLPLPCLSRATLRLICLLGCPCAGGTGWLKGTPTLPLPTLLALGHLSFLDHTTRQSFSLLYVCLHLQHTRRAAC